MLCADRLDGKIELFGDVFWYFETDPAIQEPLGFLFGLKSLWFSRACDVVWTWADGPLVDWLHRSSCFRCDEGVTMRVSNVRIEEPRPSCRAFRFQELF